MIHALVPVKQLAAGKSRLLPELSDAQRQALALAMLHDVLGALQHNLRQLTEDLETASNDIRARLETEFKTKMGAVEAEFGVADVVVNNAGLSHPGLLKDATPEAIGDEIAVNLTGPAYICQRALVPLYAEGLRGDFVFISSDAKRWPRPYQSIYTATKAGLEGLASALALEFEGTGLRSTVIRVGPAMSEYAATWGEALITRLVTRWQHFGLQRHLAMMPGEAIGRAVVTAVTTPEGVRVDTIEVQPEAPLDE